jgi:predicted metal-dependent hydrolase
VSNREQVENLLLSRMIDLLETQSEYESMYYKYKMKLSAVDDILTALAQRIKSLQNENKYI